MTMTKKTPKSRFMDVTKVDMLATGINEIDAENRI